MQEENKEFYVYIYLDPRKPGIYEYGDYKFDYEPFYVGKGKGSRMYEHLYRNDKHNSHKTNKIKSILGEGIEPIILKVKESLCEIDAYELEIDLIKLIGRKCTKEGILTNISEGGGKIGALYGENNSFYNRKRTEDHKNKMQLGFEKYLLKLKCDDEYRKQVTSKTTLTKKKKYGFIPNGWKGRHLDEKHKLKISEANKLNQLGNKNSQYGTCWIHNLELEQNKKIKREELNNWLSENWIEGRKMKF